MENTPLNSIIVFQDSNITEHKDCCIICLNDFNLEEPTYTIEECRHKFHTNCLLKWFISNNSSCPTCRNINNNPSYFERKHKFKFITNYSRRKNANIYVKSIMKKYKKQQEVVKHHDLELKNFKKEHKILQKKYIQLLKKTRNGHRKLYRLKEELTDIPIFLKCL
jgi:hypothetical protein